MPRARVKPIVRWPLAPQHSYNGRYEARASGSRMAGLLLSPGQADVTGRRRGLSPLVRSASWRARSSTPATASSGSRLHVLGHVAALPLIARGGSDAAMSVGRDRRRVAARGGRCRRGWRIPRRVVVRRGLGGPSRCSAGPGMWGHSSPQPMVTTTSACSASSGVSVRGLRFERSTRNSRMTVTTSAWTCSSGAVPADSARWRPSTARSNSAAAICERPALCRQTNRAVAMHLLWRIVGALALTGTVGEDAGRGTDRRRRPARSRPRPARQRRPGQRVGRAERGRAGLGS
jgi:hypothetical protein